MKTLVQVTQAHIDAGISCNARKCPIALALKEAFNVEQVAVAGGSCCIGVHGYTLPKVASDFAHAFDLHRSVKPFSFELTHHVPLSL